MIALYLAIGAATLALRSSFIVSGLSGSSSRFEPLRRYVQIAALTALVVPALLPHEGEFAGARVIAGVAAAIVVWRTKDVLITVAVGLGALLLLR